MDYNFSFLEKHAIKVALYAAIGHEEDLQSSCSDSVSAFDRNFLEALKSAYIKLML